MDSYIKTLQEFSESWQRLKKLEPPYLQEKEVFESLVDILINHSPHIIPPKITNNKNIKRTSALKSIQNRKTLPTADEWILVSQASEITGINKGRISRFANEGSIVSNGQKGKSRKLLKSSVLLKAQALKEQKELKEYRKEAYEIKKLERTIPDRH